MFVERVGRILCGVLAGNAGRIRSPSTQRVLNPVIFSVSLRHFLPATLVVAFLAACEPAPPQEPPPEAAGQRMTGTANINLSLIDSSIQSGDDFFRHANGAWLDSYDLPPDKSTFGNFYALHEQSQERVQGLIEELAAGAPEKGSIGQKIGDYYASFLDTDTLDALGFEPIAGELAEILNLSRHSDLPRAFSWAIRAGGTAPIALSIQIDRKKPARFIGAVYATGLGLPERDYYLEDSERFEEIRSAYVAHLSLIHISEPTRLRLKSRMPSSA